MFFDSWADVGRVLLTGVVVYAFLIAVLRLAGKRTLAKLNAFDLVVTVSLGSVLATVVVSRDVSWSEAAAAIGVLVLAQLSVAGGSARYRMLRGAVRAAPAVILRDGALLDGAMRDHRITESDVRQAVRSAGHGGLDRIAAVVLESDGSLSVVSRGNIGDGSAIPARSEG